MTDQTSDRILDVAEQYAAYLDGEGPEPQFDDLTGREYVQAKAVCAALSNSWHASDLDPPPLELDPLAVSLGLVPDPTLPLNGSALRQARQRSKFTVSDVAARLKQRGWETRTADVYSWERSDAAAVPPAIVAALADELRVTERQLAGRSASLPPVVEAVTLSSSFRSLAQRWATAIGLGDEARGAASLQQLMLSGAVRRGDELDADAWIVAIQALVEARENPRDEQ
jgi:transcriptional regulator with XRE-family HTH domain